MTWIVLAGSLAAVLLIAGTAWLLGLGRDRRIESPEEAVAAAEAALGGFHAANAVVGTDAAAALVVDGEGRVAVCKRRGARLAVREVGWTAVRSTPAGLLVDTGERRFGTVTVAGVDALDARRLAPQPMRA